MVKHNYRGRFHGDPIDMVAEGRREPMGSFFTYNKFWVALAGVALSMATSATGVDFSLFGITPEAVVSMVTAIAVWAIPNATS